MFLANTLLYTAQDISLAICSCMCLSSFLGIFFIRQIFGLLGGIFDLNSDGSVGLFETLIGGGGVLGVLGFDNIFDALGGIGDIFGGGGDDNERGGRR